PEALGPLVPCQLPQPLDDGVRLLLGEDAVVDEAVQRLVQQASVGTTQLRLTRVTGVRGLARGVVLLSGTSQAHGVDHGDGDGTAGHGQRSQTTHEQLPHPRSSVRLVPSGAQPEPGSGGSCNRGEQKREKAPLKTAAKEAGAEGAADPR